MIATIAVGRLYVLGTTDEPGQRVVLDGRFETTSNDAKTFQFELVYHPASCIVGVRIASAVHEAVVSDCGQRGPKGDAGGLPVAEAPDGARQSRAMPPALPEAAAPEAPSAVQAVPPPPRVAAIPEPTMTAATAADPAGPAPALATHGPRHAPLPPLRPSDADIRVAATTTRPDRPRHRRFARNDREVRVSGRAQGEPFRPWRSHRRAPPPMPFPGDRPAPVETDMR